MRFCRDIKGVGISLREVWRMRVRTLLPALLLSLGLLGLVAVPSPAADKADAKKIAKLIEKLGSGDYEDRDAATKELEKIGEPALDALRKAADSKDAEVRKRAGALVSKLDKKLEAAKFLTPTTIHLTYKNTPVGEAVADFAKKSGVTIVLQDPAGKLKDRKVTLDTGKTTFWDAYEQFLEKAGLTEYDPSTAPLPPGGPYYPPGG